MAHARQASGHRHSGPFGPLIQSGQQAHPDVREPRRPRIGRAERAADIVRALGCADEADVAGLGFGAHHTNITDHVLTSCKSSELLFVNLLESVSFDGADGVEAVA